MFSLFPFLLVWSANPVLEEKNHPASMKINAIYYGWPGSFMTFRGSFTNLDLLLLDFFFYLKISPCLVSHYDEVFLFVCFAICIDWNGLVARKVPPFKEYIWMWRYLTPFVLTHISGTRGKKSHLCSVTHIWQFSLRLAHKIYWINYSCCYHIFYTVLVIQLENPSIVI